MNNLNNLHSFNKFQKLNSFEKRYESFKTDFSSYNKIYEAPSFVNSTGWGESLLGMTVNKLFSWIRRGYGQAIAKRNLKKIEDVILNVLLETMEEINAENIGSEDEAKEAFEEAKNIEPSLMDEANKIYYFNKYEKYLVSAFENNWSEEYKKVFGQVIDDIYDEVMYDKPALSRDLKEYENKGLKKYVDVDKIGFEEELPERYEDEDEEEQDEEQDEDDKEKTVKRIEASPFEESVENFFEIFEDIDSTETEKIKEEFENYYQIVFSAIKTYHTLLNLETYIYEDGEYERIKERFENVFEKLRSSVQGVSKSPNYGYVYGNPHKNVKYEAEYKRISDFFKKKEKEIKDNYLKESTNESKKILEKEKSSKEKIKEKGIKKDTKKNKSEVDIDKLESYYGDDKMNLLKDKKKKNQDRLENRKNKIFALYLSFLRSVGLDIPQGARTTSEAPNLGISEKDKQRANSFFEKRLFNIFDNYSDYFVNIEKVNPKNLAKDSEYLSGYNKDNNAEKIETKETDNTAKNVKRFNLNENLKNIFGQKNIKSKDNESFIRNIGIIKLPENLGILTYGFELQDHLYIYHIIDLIDLSPLLEKIEKNKVIDKYKESSVYFSNGDLNIVNNVTPDIFKKNILKNDDFGKHLIGDDAISFCFFKNKMFRTGASSKDMSSLFSKINSQEKTINPIIDSQIIDLRKIENIKSFQKSVSFKKDFITIIENVKNLYSNVDLNKIQNKYKTLNNEDLNYIKEKLNKK